MKRIKNRESILIRLLYHRITITLIGFVILVSIAVPLAKNVSKQYKINSEIEELQSEITRLQSKNMEFKKLMNYLESDQFVEEQARLNLSYKKQGESVVVINPNGKEDELASEPANGARSSDKYKAEASRRRSNANNWWQYFFR